MTFDMPPASAGFDARAGWVVTHLMVDLPALKLNHAGGILGNLGGESGLEVVNERHPLIVGSRGGWSWGQWTGDRRVGMERFCTLHGFDLAGDEAAYRWLIEELLHGEHHAFEQLLKTSSIEAAVETFEVYYERPSRIELVHRTAFAKRAIAAALGLAHVEHFQNPSTTGVQNQKPAGSEIGPSSSSSGGLAPGPTDPAGRPSASTRRSTAHPLHLAGGMGIGLALTDTLAWCLGPDVAGVLVGHSFIPPQGVAAGWALLLSIPGAVLLHRMPWLNQQLGDRP